MSYPTIYEHVPNVKIVLLGESTVGKTSIINVVHGGTYIQDQPTTIGACFYIKKVIVDNVPIKLHIWDTAGQERFKSISPMYFRDADITILVFAVNNLPSFNSLSSWYESIKDTCPIMPQIFIFANKTDLSERAVTQETGQQFANEIGAKYFEVSAKTKQDEIINIFDSIANNSLADLKKQGGFVNEQEPSVQINNNNQKEKKCC